MVYVHFHHVFNIEHQSINFGFNESIIVINQKPSPRKGKKNVQSYKLRSCIKQITQLFYSRIHSYDKLSTYYRVNKDLFYFLIQYLYHRSIRSNASVMLRTKLFCCKYKRSPLSASLLGEQRNLER